MPRRCRPYLLLASLLLLTTLSKLHLSLLPCHLYGLLRPPPSCRIPDTPPTLDFADQSLLEPDCGNRHLLVYVVSAAGEAQLRAAIRETWGAEINGESRRLIFALGRGEEDLSKEAAVYGDLLVFDFQDHYLNLTRKTLATLDWLATNCKSNYTLRIDSDWILLPSALPALLATVRPEQNVIAGYCSPVHCARLREDPRLSCIPDTPLYFPASYCFGFSQLVTRAGMERLGFGRNSSGFRSLSYSPLEDVTMGLLASHSHVPLLPLRRLFPFPSPSLPHLPCHDPILVLSGTHDALELRLLWAAYRKRCPELYRPRPTT